MNQPCARTHRRVPRLTALVGLVVLLTVACGPRFDRSELVLAGGIPAGDTAGTSAPVDTDGDGIADPGGDGGTVPGEGDAGFGGSSPTGPGAGTDAPPSGNAGDPAGNGSDGDGTATPDPATGDPAGPEPDRSTPPSSGAVEPGPRPGITDDTIKIGYLVPLTGAAPIPTSWDDGANLYWDVNQIAGRDVELIIYDTESNTSTAVQRARQLVTQDEVFTIVTLDRLEVQAAVANELEARNYPHIMVQSPTPAPADWKNTFTISIDHTVQGRAIARFFDQDLPDKGTKVAVVREETSALKPGADAFVAEARRLGLEVVAEETINPQAGQYSGTILSLQQAGAELVWLYMAPQPAVTIINQSGGYDPVWFANSISWGFELIHPLTPDLDGRAFAFSPWVPLSNPRTDTYKAAYREEVGGTPDDIGLVGWGVGEVVDAALSAPGDALGHDSFRRSMATFRADTQVWAPLDFRGGGSVGAQQVAVYQTSNGAWTSFGGDFRSF